LPRRDGRRFGRIGARQAQVQPIFVTIDPARDSIGRLGPYVAHSGHAYLLDDRGRVRAAFGQNVTVREMTGAVTRLLDETT
jgi:cytochrome oxidase Cu insertion factor (SCO1/SenC/PrrC family)